MLYDEKIGCVIEQDYSIVKDNYIPYLLLAEVF
jgi:hypothetical protein